MTTIQSVFRYKLSELEVRRNAAMTAGATAHAIDLTDDILELIERQKTLTSRLTGRIPHSE